MWKIDRRTSVTLSFVLAWLFLGGLIAGAGLLPWLMVLFEELGYWGDSPVDRIVTLCLLYAVLAVAFVAIVVLLLLLKRVRAGEVFCGASVGYLRLLSWACFGEALLFGVLTALRSLSPLGLAASGILCVAALFLGLLLRVVKNVIEEATHIKAENDFTI